MHIAAFVATGTAVIEGESVTATGVPWTQVILPGELPMQVAAPILLCVWSEAGNDQNPCIYVQVRDPNGVQCGNVELIWLWDDVEGQPVKWHVWALMVPFELTQSGVFTFGIYNHPDDAETAYWFPLSIQVGEGGPISGPDLPSVRAL